MCAYPQSSLQFDRRPAIYETGENVSGFIVVDKEKLSMDVIGVKVKMKGKAKSYYQSGRSRREEIEVLVEREVSIIKQGENFSGKYSLPIGKHTFPFSFRLPYLPATFTTHNGHVEYYIKVIISVGITSTCVGLFPKPFQGEQKRKFSFYVLSSISLSKVALWKEPAVVEKERNVNIFKEGGMAGYKFQLFKREYVPLEELKFHGSFYNQSKYKICTKLKLIQTVILGSCEGRLNTCRKVLQILKGPELGPSERRVWDWFDESYSPPLVIPQSVFVSESSALVCVVNYLRVEMGVKYGPIKSRFKDRIYIKIGAQQTETSPDIDWVVIHQKTADPWLKRDSKIKYLKLK